MDFIWQAIFACHGRLCNVRLEESNDALFLVWVYTTQGPALCTDVGKPVHDNVGHRRNRGQSSLGAILSC